MRVLLLLAALLCGTGCLAADSCDTEVSPRFVEVGQLRLAYQSIGAVDDPALLMVMGLGGQWIHWPDSVVRRLCEDGFRVIRFDNRDAGLTTWNARPPELNLRYQALRHRLGLPVNAPYRLRDMALDSLGLMDALGIERFHLLGASMGGMIAQHIADMQPQRVASLTLVMTSSGAAGLPAPSESLLRLLAEREAGSRAEALQQQVELLAALGSRRVSDDRAVLLQQAEQAYSRSFNPQGVQRQLAAILAEDSRVELLARLNVPTLVVHGTDDPLLPVMHGVHVAAHIRGADLRLIPGLAHRFQDAFREPLLKAVLPHLASHREHDTLARL